MKKDKQFLMVKITHNDGGRSDNPLRLSEAHLISKIAKENKSLEVRVITTSAEAYNTLFGITSKSFLYGK